MASECNLDKKTTRAINYLNKDFGSFRTDLVNYAKNYFPDVYNDFNETSPGMMFIEMAAYVGDVLSYYVDNQMKESLLMHAEERDNIIDIAKAIGYTTKPTVPSIVKLCVYQVVPAQVVGNAVGASSPTAMEPDMRYAMTIAEGMVIQASDLDGQLFITQAAVDFSISKLTDPLETTVYQVDEQTSLPTYYLLKKTVSAMSGDKRSSTYTFTSPKKFDKIKLPYDNIIAILSMKDSDTNEWREVPYLAQDNIFEDVINNWTSDPLMSQYNYDAPYILKLRRTARRFTTHVRADNFTEVWFGAGVSTQADELIVPNPDNIGMQLPYGNTAGNYMNGTDFVDVAFDPANTMFTRAYGEAPANTTLTITYLIGGGIKSNVPARTINKVISSTIWLDEDGLESTVITTVKESVACINLEAAVGGRSAETTDDIKQNALAHYSSQNRAVTREDYIARVYAMPGKYGSVAKCYLDKDEQYWIQTVGTHEIKNPLAINLYTLGYDDKKNCIPLTELAKENLQKFLSQYRMLTDAINIKTAHVINIGVDFAILPRPGYQSKEVLLKCINKLKCIFDIDNWSINEPIILPKVATELDKVEGVQTVKKLRIFNLYGQDKYSPNIYDTKGATKDGVIYPSMDPCIFEVKYPEQDIRGRIEGY